MADLDALVQALSAGRQSEPEASLLDRILARFGRAATTYGQTRGGAEIPVAIAQAEAQRVRGIAEGMQSAMNGEFGAPGSDEFMQNALPSARDAAGLMMGGGANFAERGALGIAGGRPYQNVPDSLMGFRRNGPNRGFDQENYPHIQNVEVDLGNGNKFTDAIKGLNQSHALERAQRNWPDAIIKALVGKSGEGY